MSQISNDKRMHSAPLTTTMNLKTEETGPSLQSIKTEDDSNRSTQKPVPKRRKHKYGKIPAPRGYRPRPGYTWDVVTGKERKRIMMDDLRGKDKSNWENYQLRLRAQKRKEERLAELKIKKEEEEELEELKIKKEEEEELEELKIKKEEIKKET